MAGVPVNPMAGGVGGNPWDWLLNLFGGPAAPMKPFANNQLPGGVAADITGQNTSAMMQNNMSAPPPPTPNSPMVQPGVGPGLDSPGMSLIDLSADVANAPLYEGVTRSAIPAVGGAQLPTVDAPDMSVGESLVGPPPVPGGEPMNIDPTQAAPSDIAAGGAMGTDAQRMARALGAVQPPQAPTPQRISSPQLPQAKPLPSGLLELLMMSKEQADKRNPLLSLSAALGGR